MNDKSLQARLEFIGIDRATRDALREMQPMISTALPQILDRFYRHVVRIPNLAGMFGDKAAIDHAKRAQIAHWGEIVSGAFDDAYLKSATRIGRAHHRLGLEPRWYIAGYSFIITGLLQAIELGIAGGLFAGRASREKKAALQTAITRAAMLDMDLAISVYLDAAKEAQQAAVRTMADTFEATIGDIINTVSSTSSELEASAGSLTKTAETTQSLSSDVAAASSQVSGNVQSVASATEQMASSVGAIGRQVAESTSIAAEAVRQVEKTDANIGELSHTAERIGDVLKLITSIAAQTNLLALNATIEAARAGDAGRGFAVVASEVKALASQTAQATDNIAQQIVGIQSATQEAVTAIKRVGGTIHQMSGIASGIAAAVEEQGASTREISRNVQEVAGGTAKVATSISEVSRGASDTGSAATHVLASAQSLSRESHRLKLELDRFLDTFRAA